MNKAATNIKDGKLYFNITQVLHALGRENELKNTSVLRDIGNSLCMKGIKKGTGKAPVPGMLGRYYVVDINSFEG
jgi:hypothetical protein